MPDTFYNYENTVKATVIAEQIFCRINGYIYSITPRFSTVQGKSHVLLAYRVVKMNVASSSIHAEYYSIDKALKSELRGAVTGHYNTIPKEHFVKEYNNRMKLFNPAE